jgi:hypothetical protein
MNLQSLVWRGVLALMPFLLLFCTADSACAEERASSASTIAFRLGKWKSMHFDNAELAKQHLATVKQIGCEARQEKHGGHIDVTYRCAAWRPLVVGSEELAHQWESWLQDSGFETLHGHSAADEPAHLHDDHQHAHHEQVAYRLARKISKHFDSEEEASQFATVMQALGCEVTKSDRDERHDVSFQCSDWMLARFSSHDAAHGWESWLKENGFETRHTH